MSVRAQLAIYLVQQYVAVILAWLLNFRVLRWFFRQHPVPGDSRISATWLTSALRTKNVLSADNEVTSVLLTDLSGNHGHAGAMTRLVPTYKTKTAATPASFILKTGGSDSNGRRWTIIGGRVREAIFYSKCAQLVPADLPPRAFSSYQWNLLGDYAMVLEDLELIKTVPVSHVFGNQVWGIKDPVTPPIDQGALMRALFVRCADMHAQHWRSKALLDQRWLKCVEWYHGQGRARWQISIDFAHSCWKKALTQLDAAGSKPAWTLSPKLRRIVDLSFANSSWEKLQAHLRDPLVPWTLTHGDFHAGNMRFQPHESGDVSKGRLILFDWSEIGPWEPTADLGQMLISDIKPEVFRAHSKDSLQAYWQRLKELGVREETYTFERCWAAFCRGCVEKWVWMLAVMSCFPVPPTLLQYFNDQMLGFIESHNEQPYYELKPVVCIG